jgi:hypothetical protein
VKLDQLERAYDFPGGRLRHIYRSISLPSEPLLQEVATNQPAVPFGAGLALEQPCTAALPAEGDEVVGFLEVGVASGRPACIAIRALHGHALTGAYLRSLPIATLVLDAGLAHTVRVYRTPRGAYVGVRYVKHPDIGFGDDFRELESEVRTRMRHSLDDSFLEQVARTYREALPTGRPAKAVEENFGPTTPENARRWIMLARRRGLLGKAPGRGQTGERKEGS